MYYASSNRKTIAVYPTPCAVCKEDWQCCSTNGNCQEGDGDCDLDSDCAGAIILHMGMHPFDKRLTEN